MFDLSRITLRGCFRLFLAVIFIVEVVVMMRHPSIQDAFVGIITSLALIEYRLEDEIRERRTINIESKVHLHQYICMDEDGKPIVITRREKLKTS
jgi:hypothetical protein